MSLMHRVESGEIHPGVMVSWCSFHGMSVKEVYRDETRYKILFVTAILDAILLTFISPFFWFNISKLSIIWSSALVGIILGLFGLLILCLLIVSYNSNPDLSFNDDWREVIRLVEDKIPACARPEIVESLLQQEIKKAKTQENKLEKEILVIKCGTENSRYTLQAMELSLAATRHKLRRLESAAPKFQSAKA